MRMNHRQGLAVCAAALAGVILAAPLVWGQEAPAPQTPPGASPPQGAPPNGAPGAGAPARPPAPQAKPGYVVPPENSAGLYPVNGEPIFKAKCAQCHEPAIDRAPARDALKVRSPEEVYDALT